MTEYAFRKAANKPINFYGLVLDQNREPISGVEIEISILSYNDNLEDFGKNRSRQKNEKIRFGLTVRFLEFLSQPI